MIAAATVNIRQLRRIWTTCSFVLGSEACHLHTLLFVCSRSSSHTCRLLRKRGHSSQPGNRGEPCCDLTVIGGPNSCSLPPPSLFSVEDTEETGGRDFFFFFCVSSDFHTWCVILLYRSVNGTSAAQKVRVAMGLKDQSCGLPLGAAAIGAL